MRGTSCHKRRRNIGAIFLTMLLWLAWGNAAAASELRIRSDQCHAVTPVSAPDAIPDRFACSGPPQDYQRASLWYRVTVNDQPLVDDGVVVMVHNSRFDRLAVAFTYADGAVIWEQVRAGDYGTHWRSGGQIAFDAPQRDAPLESIALRFDKPASAKLLRMRLMNHGDETHQSTALAASVGAALMLLLIGALYNASLAFAVRRQFPAWQGAWAATMVLWGACWSQLHLFLFPGMAGVTSAQVCTALSCLAIGLATATAITAPRRDTIPRYLRLGTLTLGALMALSGVPLAFVRVGPLDAMADVLGVMTLLDLAAVALCMIIAGRRGSSEAIGFASGWAVPMLALGSTQFIDTSRMFWGGGAQILVLFAAAWQTVWLSVAVSRIYARLRVERDLARSAEASAHELARRDPLTGLRNRRGFIEQVTPMLAHAERDGTPVALLVIDVDHFKSINDTFGHDAGDRVLAQIARRLGRWEGEMCSVARMGGEEFALIIAGIEGFALARFAEGVCNEIGNCDHAAEVGARRVTVSIGVAEAPQGADFKQLYRQADAALYTAKREGRDQVAMRPEAANAALADDTAPELLPQIAVGL